VHKPESADPTRSLALAVTGSGGTGAVTVGLILLQAAARAGLYGLMSRSAGPQIRGGESAAMLRLGTVAQHCMDDRFDLLLGLDWLNTDQFADELPLDAASLVLADPDAGEVPESVLRSGARVRQVPLRALAGSVAGGRINMVALGLLANACGLPGAAVEAGLRHVLAGKGEQVLEGALACLALGLEQASELPAYRFEAQDPAPPRWNVTGNEACGLGALRAGVRFVAAYPITPASDLLEWLAPRLQGLGGTLFQAEDELAAINMCIGASFGGVPALTATSGPGLSLMLEGLGLAVASETPVTVIDVMRGGPSTGIPTKSEQADLNIALYGTHGDAPHLVLAPVDVGDCVFTTQWAVQLAEHLQTVAVVLSDQALGQSRAVTPIPEPLDLALRRSVASPTGAAYQRYAERSDGVSPMALPGSAFGIYTADGLEHDARGLPSSSAADHRRQLDKRARKLADHDFGPCWAETSGSGPVCLVTWGSSCGAVREAAARLAAGGRSVRVIALRLLMPLQTSELTKALAGSERVWVIEQNHSGQLFGYLGAHAVLPPGARSLARPGPLPLRPGEIIEALAEEAHDG
jgi:2-oxoglutarate ferredoxin oxidoreductase subunit alpha